MGGVPWIAFLVTTPLKTALPKTKTSPVGWFVTFVRSVLELVWLFRTSAFLPTARLVTELVRLSAWAARRVSHEARNHHACG